METTFRATVGYSKDGACRIGLFFGRISELLSSHWQADTLFLIFSTRKEAKYCDNR
jgi:hypothetical protein